MEGIRKHLSLVLALPAAVDRVSPCGGWGKPPGEGGI